MKGASEGKATTIRCWEIAGIVSGQPLSTYPDGFSKKVPEAFGTAVDSGVDSGYSCLYGHYGACIWEEIWPEARFEIMPESAGISML